VILEILWPPWDAIFFEIGRRCRHDAPDTGQPAGDETAIGGLANPDRHVEVFLDRIGKPVVQGQPDTQIAVLEKKPYTAGPACDTPNDIGALTFNIPRGFE